MSIHVFPRDDDFGIINNEQDSILSDFNETVVFAEPETVEVAFDKSYDDQSDDPEKQTAQKNQIDDYANEGSYGYIQEDIPGNRAVTEAYLRGDMETYYRLAEKEPTRTSLPSKYDSRNYGYVTPVKNQNPYGSCWAHAALACVETYMIKHGVRVGTGSVATTSLNLSETQHCFFTYTNAYDAEGMLKGDKTTPVGKNCLNRGGTGSMSAYTLQRWTGAASESDAALQYSKASTVINSGLDSKYAYNYNVCHVQNSVWVPAEDIEAVKQNIMEYGAGYLPFYSRSNTYICTKDESKYSNHAVTVVGWDDSIAKNLFSPDKPSKPGAWICKNSWGTGCFDNGYCYISYEDTTLLSNHIYFYDAEPINNYDHNYQYDGSFNFDDVYKSLDNNSQIANIFTAKGAETLNAVAFCTFDEAVSYTIRIYKNPTTGNPSSGTLMTTQSGSITFPGYYTIRLNKSVLLEARNSFAVVISLSSVGNNVTVPYNKSQELYDPDDGEHIGTTIHANHGETSYYKTPNGSWTDCPNNGDFRVKAFTTNRGDAVSYYLSQCKPYPTYGVVQTTASTPLWNMPCSDKTNPDATYNNETLPEGETIVVTEFYKNTADRYWYRVNHNGEDRYIYCGNTQWQKWIEDDIKQPNPTNPEGQLEKGKPFTIKGDIYSQYNILSKVSAHVYYANSTTDAINPGEETVNTRKYKLEGSAVDRGLKFGNLSVGNYTYAVKVECIIYHSDDGKTQITETKEHPFPTSQFSVVDSTTQTYTVTFNANGGSVSPSSKTVTYGSTYGTLPTPTRTGYTFDGWYTSSSGGSQVTSSTKVTTASNHTLYAHWTEYRYLEINEFNFPDANFRQWIIENLPVKGDAATGYYMTQIQVESVTEIDCSDRGIGSLSGIEFFPGLIKLICQNNQLTVLDASQNTALTSITCSDNQLTSLDFSRNTSLKSIDCGFNRLTALNVSKNTALTSLDCQSNQLKSLDISKNTALTGITCSGNQLSALDVSNNTALTILFCNRNQLTVLDVSNNTALQWLYCYSNQLTELNVKNTALKKLKCYGNHLGVLELGTLSNLSEPQLGQQTIENREGMIINGVYTFDLSTVVPKDRLARVTLQDSTLQLNTSTGIVAFPSAVDSFTYLYDTEQGQMDVTVYLSFECATVTVTFDPNGGSVSPTSKTVTYGSAYGTLPTPTRTGYTFDGWYTVSSGGSQVTSSTTVTTASNHTLYAHWNGDRYLEINETNFPDANFRNWIINNLTVSGDAATGYFMTRPQVESVTRIDCQRCGISSLSGIEHFFGLITLKCNYNELNELDISKNTALTMLDCYYNQLTALDVSKNTVLEYLLCYHNQLTALDISRNTALYYFHCDYNQLTTLDVSNNLALNLLSCGNNQLTALDVSKNTVLTRLDCNDNKLTTLDVSKNTALRYLYCYSNQLKTLDVSKNTALQWLYCYSNQLTELNVKNTALEKLKCYDNHLGVLELGTLSNLSEPQLGQQTIENREGMIINGVYTFDLSTVVPKDRLARVTLQDSTLQLNTSTGIVAFPSAVDSFTYLYDTEQGQMDVTVYLSFECATVTVTFDPNGGSVSTSSKTVTYGSTYGDLPTPTRTGYNFDGWYTTASGGSKVTSSTTVTTASNHTLYAHWTPRTYTVNFSPNGGSMDTTSMEVTYDSPYGELPTPTRTKYIFDGWYTAASGGTKITSSTKVTTAANHRLYAHWTKNDATFDGTIEWNSADVEYKGTTPYVIANGSAQTPRFTVKDKNGNVVDASNYTYQYRENTNAGTGYVIVTFKSTYSGTAQGWFKIYLPPTTNTTVENVGKGILITWDPVPGAAGYVIYRRAWSSKTNGWTTFERWWNVTGTSWIDGSDSEHRVYAGSRYQYGIKAYFEQRVDPVSGATIGGNVGDNYNLGVVGPLKTMVRITTMVLNSVTPGSKQLTVKWNAKPEYTGYQVQIATDTSFTKNVQTVKITDPTASQTTIKNLKSGTTYYVRIRAYHVFEGTTYYGKWTDAQNCTVN